MLYPMLPPQNTILGLEKQVLWRHCTPKRIESENGAHFKNSLVRTLGPKIMALSRFIMSPIVHQLLLKWNDTMGC